MSNFNEITLDYFNGDELAAKVWTNKYQLKDKDGNPIESSPDDMHKNRLAPEFARIDAKYKNPKSAETFYNALKGFKYIIPGGSPMSGIGNDNQVVSISNCFVIGNPEGTDSYGGIMKIDEEIIQLCKRRGGVGTDLSDIRPNGSKVSNAALTSTGIVPFMERYSNTVREVGQSGRRGALMLSISCRHPESDAFISAKLEQGKVTGANISIKFDDEFMDCVINDKKYYQYFPIHEDINKIIPSDILNGVTEVDMDKVYSGMMEGSCFKVIKAKKLWDKVIYNAWRSAEPGVMFFDEILRNTPTKPYFDKGFKPVSTNPCFTGDTLVMTEDFPEGIRIDELAKFGQVKFDVPSATDFDCDGDTVWYKELKQAIAFKTGTKEIIKLNLSNGTSVRCTPDHRFALNDGTYVKAKDSLGKLLVTYDVFTDVTVDSIESNGEMEDVYDLTVDDNHTFYIICGKDAILVHNCGEVLLQSNFL